MDNIKISVLVVARKNSRFLPHYLFAYFNNTYDLENTELLIMCSKNDEWNQGLFEYFGKKVKFFFEDRKMGKHGRHFYYNDLLKEATGDWVLHTCDDHVFIKRNWDTLVRKQIKRSKIDKNKVNIFIPQFDNTGWVAQMVSKGLLNATQRMGGHGNIDSWYGGILDVLPKGRIHISRDKLMRDLTVDVEIFLPEYMMDDVSEGKKLPKWESEEVQDDLANEIKKIQKAIKNEL